MADLPSDFWGGWIAVIVLTFHWARVVWSRTAVQLAADELRVSSESGSSPERFRSVATLIERIASVVHQVPDLRMLYENDARLLEQFGA